MKKSPETSTEKTNEVRPSITLDPLIHESTRLQIISVLNSCELADFNFLRGACALTGGNLSRHMSKLVTAGLVNESKRFLGKMPHTEYHLTPAGKSAFQRYLADWKALTTGGKVTNAKSAMDNANRQHNTTSVTR